jgi:excinuclease UvrABC helicase subunit UvrB
MPDYRVQMGPTTNKDVDVQYLMQEIDAEEWQRQLEFTEARMRRKQEIGMILQMATTAAADIFRRITVEMPTMEPVTINSWLESVILAELEQLRVFVNTAFVELAKRQKQAVPNLGFQWKWQPVRALYKATAAST